MHLGTQPSTGAEPHDERVAVCLIALAARLATGAGGVAGGGSCRNDFFNWNENKNESTINVTSQVEMQLQKSCRIF